MKTKLRAAATTHRGFHGPVDQKVCPYCSGESFFLVSSTDNNRHTTDAVFNYYQCSQCALVFLSPIPEDMRPFYAGGYQKIPRDISELRTLAKDEKYRLHPMLKYKTGGKLLEIGPWIGLFSCNAKDAGFDVTAIEMNEDCLAFLRNTLGIKAIGSPNPANTLAQMTERFDVIALWHSLEHLPTPWLVIEEAAKLLAPRGVLIIAIPNIDSYEFSFLGRAWKHLDAPRHLYFYPIQSLCDICVANGLVKLEITTKDKLSRLLSRDNFNSWATSVLDIRYLRGALGLSFYWLTRLIQVRGGVGCGCTALFRKPID